MDSTRRREYALTILLPVFARSRELREHIERETRDCDDMRVAYLSLSTILHYHWQSLLDIEPGTLGEDVVSYLIEDCGPMALAELLTDSWLADAHDPEEVSDAR